MTTLFEIDWTENKPKIRIVGNTQTVLDIAGKFGRPGEKTMLRAELYNEDPTLATSPMFRYLWGHLANVLLDYLQNQGWTISSKEVAVEIMKPELGFTESVWNGDGNVFVFPLSLSNKNGFPGRKRKSKFIEDLRIWLLENGCRVMTPDEYEKELKCDY